MSETLRMINALSDAEELHRKHMKQLRASHQSEIARLTKANTELCRTGEALMTILNCGHRYVDNQGFKCPEFLALEKALANSSEGE